MKTLIWMFICVVTMASCMGSNHAMTSASTYNPKGGSASNVRMWKPAKDKTPYQKYGKYAERD